MGETERRRRADAPRLSRRLSMPLDEVLWLRLGATASKYGVTTASVARMAVEAGLDAARKRLSRERASRERAYRAATRPEAEPGTDATEADEAAAT